jgi:hypothetical protein
MIVVEERLKELFDTIGTYDLPRMIYHRKQIILMILVNRSL